MPLSSENIEELPLMHSGLSAAEHWWRSRYRWLQSKGYQLGPRFDPDWVPSWLGTSKTEDNSEDGQVLTVSLKI